MLFPTTPTEDSAHTALQILKQPEASLPDPTLRQTARAHLSAYATPRRAAGQPLFPNLQRQANARHQEKLRSYFLTEDIAELMPPDRAAVYRSQLAAHPQPTRYAARVANTGFLKSIASAAKLRLTPETYEPIRNAYARQHLGMSDPKAITDESFHTSLRTRFQTEAANEATIQQTLSDYYTATLTTTERQPFPTFPETLPAELRAIAAERALTLGQEARRHRRKIQPIAQRIAADLLALRSETQTTAPGVDTSYPQSLSVEAAMPAAIARAFQQLPADPQDRAIAKALIARELQAWPEDTRAVFSRSIANLARGTIQAIEGLTDYAFAADRQMFGLPEGGEYGIDSARARAELREFSNLVRAADPLKKATDTFLQTGTLGVAQSIPYTLAALAGPTGFALMGASFAGQSITEQAIASPEASETARFVTGSTTGAVESAVETLITRAGVKLLAGRVPTTFGILNRLGIQSRSGRAILGGATATAAATAMEFGEEVIQDASRAMAADIARELSGLAPQTDWQKFLSDWTDLDNETTYQTLAATTVFGLVGGGLASFSHFRYGEYLRKNRAILHALGVPEAKIEEIATGTDVTQVDKAFQEAFQTGLEARTEDQRKAALEIMRELYTATQASGLPRITAEQEFGTDATTYVFTDPITGTTETFETEEAALMHWRDWGMAHEAETLERFEKLSETGLLDFLTQEGQASEETEVRTTERTRQLTDEQAELRTVAEQQQTALDRETRPYLRAEIEEALDRTRSALDNIQARITAFALMHGPAAANKLGSFLITGKRWAERTRSGLTRYIIQLYGGRSVQDVFEEFAEDAFVRALEGGLLNPQKILADIRTFEDATGQRLIDPAYQYTTQETALPLIEAFSALARAYAMQEVRHGTLPAEVAQWIQIQTTAFTDAASEAGKLLADLRRAGSVRQALETQALTPALEDLLRDAIGINEQARLRRLEKKHQAQLAAEAFEGFPEIRATMAGKLPHPTTLEQARHPLAGEVRSLYESLLRPTRRKDKAGRAVLRTNEANDYFLPPGQMVDLDLLRRSANELGFSFQNPTDLLDALTESIAYGKPHYATQSLTGESFSVGFIDLAQTFDSVTKITFAISPEIISHNAALRAPRATLAERLADEFIKTESDPIAYNPEHYYRNIDENAWKDAQELGYFRPNPNARTTYSTLFASKGATGSRYHGKFTIEIDPSKSGKWGEVSSAKYVQAEIGTVRLDGAVRVFQRNQDGTVEIVHDNIGGEAFISKGKPHYATGSALDTFGESFSITPADLSRHAALEAKHNTGPLTPEETAEAKSLVEKAAQAAGYDVKAYHGTRAKQPFTVFNHQAEGVDRQSEAPDDSFFFAATAAQAKTYSSKIMEVFLNLKDAWEFDFKGANWQGDAMGKWGVYNPETGVNEIFETEEEALQFASANELEDQDITQDPWVGESTNSFTRYAKDNGADGVILENVIDNGSFGDEPPGTVYAVFSPSQIKSAEPFTGVPLAQRFDSTRDSISYSLSPDYGIQHRPNEEGPRAFNLAENDLMPADVYQHPEWYSAMSPKIIQETMRQLRAVRNKADALLTIYRAGPAPEMNPGDWVSLSKEYARTHADSQDPEGYKVWQAKVPASDVRWDMNDLAEFGYFGPAAPATESNVSFSISAFSLTPARATSPTRNSELGTSFSISPGASIPPILPIPPISGATFSLSPGGLVRLESAIARRLSAGPEARATFYARLRDRLASLTQRLEDIDAGVGPFGRTATEDPVETERRRIQDAIAEARTIIDTLPPEARGRVPMDFADLTSPTTERGRINALLRLIDKADEALEAILRQEFFEAIERLIDLASPEVGPTRQLKTRLTPATQAEATLIIEAMSLTPEKYALDLAAAQKALSEAEAANPTTPEEATAAQQALTQAYLAERRLATFGNIGGRTAAEMEIAYEELLTLYGQGRTQRRFLDEQKRQENLAARQELIKSLGGPATQPQWAKRTEDKGFADFLSSLQLGLSSFHQVMDFLFPESTTARAFQDAIRAADRQFTRAKIDARQRFEAHLASRWNLPGRAAGRRRNAILRDLSTRRDDWNIEIREGTAFQTEKLTEEQAAAVLAGTLKPGWEADPIAMESLRQALADFRLQRLKARREEKAFQQRVIRFQRLKGRSGPAFVRLSDLEALYLLQLHGQEMYRPALDRHGYTEAVIEKLRAKIDPRALDVGDFLSREYAAEYDRLNPVFRRLYQMDMPRIRNYAPGAFDNITSTVPLPEEGGQAGGVSAMSAGFTKSRTHHQARPRQANALALYWSHLEAVEYFIAFAETLRQYKPLFNHPEVRRTMEAKYGLRVVRDFQTWLETLEVDGRHRAANVMGLAEMTQKMMAGQSAAGLTLNIGTLFKQLSAAYGVYMETDLKDAIPATLRVLANPRAFRHIFETETIQQRILAGISPEDRRLLEASKANPSTLMYLLDVGRLPIAWTDAAFTTFSGTVAYEIHRQKAAKAGLTGTQAEQYALAAMDRIVTRTAQPATTQDKSLAENTAGTFGKILFLFKSDPRQKFAISTMALRSALTGRMSKAEAARRITFAWILYGLTEEIVTDVWHTIARDQDDPDRWDISDYIAAMLAGPISGVPIVGPAIEYAIQSLIGSGGFEPSTNPLEGTTVRLIDSGLRLRTWKTLTEQLENPENPLTTYEVLSAVNTDAALLAGLTYPWAPQAAALPVLTRTTRDLWGIAAQTVDAFSPPDPRATMRQVLEAEKETRTTTRDTAAEQRRRLLRSLEALPPAQAEERIRQLPAEQQAPLRRAYARRGMLPEERALSALSAEARTRAIAQILQELPPSLRPTTQARLRQYFPNETPAE